MTISGHVGSMMVMNNAKPVTEITRYANGSPVIEPDTTYKVTLKEFDNEIMIPGDVLGIMYHDATAVTNGGSTRSDFLEILAPKMILANGHLHCSIEGKPKTIDVFSRMMTIMTFIVISDILVKEDEDVTEHDAEIIPFRRPEPAV